MSVTTQLGSSVTMLKLHEDSCIVMSTIQFANSIVMANAHPKVQSKIWNTSQPEESDNINIISGAV